jgi:hypothetical protein
MRTLQFFQIYYRDDQVHEMYPFSIPYRNTKLTTEFENQVIADIVPMVNTKLTSVCSWRLKGKRADCAHRHTGDLTLDKIRTTDYDVAILTPKSSNHKPLAAAATWHHPTWTPAIEKLREIISIPREVTHTIYENHFVADTALYQDYVRRYLRPAIDFVRATPDVYLAPSGYARLKPTADRQAVKDQLGLDDWPIGVFILERLFSIYLENEHRNIKIIPL